MTLTDTAVRKAKPETKSRKLADERGLFLHISNSGGKYWRFKYRFAGKEKPLSLGVYPDVMLADAREKRDEARTQLARDIDPGTLKQIQKQARRVAAANTFEAIAREWISKHLATKVASHRDRLSGASNATYSPILARGQLRKSLLQRFCACCAGSKLVAFWRLHTARCKTLGKCFATPLLRDVCPLIQRRPYVVHYHHANRRTWPPPPMTLAELAKYCVP